jgi:hypothetical protein
MKHKTSRKDKSRKDKSRKDKSRKDKSRRTIAFTESNKSELLIKACKNFAKPIYLMRHLHTNSNLVTNNVVFGTFKKITKGGGLSHYLPYVPLPGVEPTITYKGRHAVTKTAQKYKVTKTTDNYYTVIVSPLLRTWLSALLFIRGLMNGKPFKVTLIISPIIEKPSSGFATKPSLKSYKKFYDELKEGEHVVCKFCDNIDRRRYTCSLQQVTVKMTDKNHISLQDMYKHFDGKDPNYKAFSKGGMRIDETVYMISKSCKSEFIHMKQILVYSHGGVLRGFLNHLGLSDKESMTLKQVNGYALKFNYKNRRLHLNILYP